MVPNMIWAGSTARLFPQFGFAISSPKWMALSNLEQSCATWLDSIPDMAYYRFVVHSESQRPEDLGVMELVDDADAEAFANGVIRDLMEDHARFYFGWTMDITEAHRVVASIPFAADETRH
jgi:hypothetical protein